MFKPTIVLTVILILKAFDSASGTFIVKATDPKYNLPVPFPATTFLWGPQQFNITGPLTTLGISTGCEELPASMNLTGKIVLVPAFRGCSYETAARNVQKKKPELMVFTGKFPWAAGVEAFITDTSDTTDITTPMVSVAIYPWYGAFLNLLAAYKGNATMVATVVPDTNKYKGLFSSPVIILFLVVLVGFALLWPRTSSSCFTKLKRDST